MEHLNCFICNQLQPDGLHGLTRHFTRDHGMSVSRTINEREGGYICGQNNCTKSFVYFSDLKRHIRQHHMDNNFDEDVNIGEINNIFNVNFNEEVDRYCIQNEGEVEDIGILVEDNPMVEEDIPNILENDFRLSLRPSIIEMIGRLHSHPSMTGSMVKTIVEQFEEILTLTKISLSRSINSQLIVGQVIDHTAIENINKTLDFESSFNDLKSFNQQINSFIKNEQYINPIEIPLGHRMDSALNSKTCSYIPKTVLESCQYVPIIEVLKLILSNDEVRQAILDEQPSPDGILGSFLDGEHFKQHPFLQKFENVIRIKLYYDELEIVNPLGSKTSIHKMGAFYYQIDNLPPHMNSELSSIHVLLLCSHEDIKKYGFETILNPFINDLAKLESDEGVILNFGDERFVLRACLTSFCGDGLAVHEVFNLLGPSANKFCRMCLISRQDLLSGFLDGHECRTKQKYNEHLQFLTESNYSDPAKTETGMKGDSCLNQCRYFHVSTNKIFDIMHDLLCGICPMTIKHILHYYIVIQKDFDINFLNSSISLFNYGYLEHRNKPSANFTENMLSRKENTLSQKAMQTWLLLRSLPFMISEKIDEEDEHLHLFLLLLRIVEIVFAPKIPKTILPYLRELVRDFASCFRTLFPHVNLINKFHHLFHYIDCIKWSGPLILYSCMRFEAKHYELKLRAQNMHNYKNPAKTTIRVSQCIQSCKWGSGTATVDKLKITSGKVTLVDTIKCSQNIIALGFAKNDFIFLAKSIFINGTEYRPSLFVVLETASSRPDDLLLFGRIQEIVVIDKDVYFLVSVHETEFFDTTVHAYCIRSHSNDQRFIKATALPFYKSFCFWSKPGSSKMYISIRHMIL